MYVPPPYNIYIFILTCTRSLVVQHSSVIVATFALSVTVLRSTNRRVLVTVVLSLLDFAGNGRNSWK